MTAKELKALWECTFHHHTDVRWIAATEEYNSLTGGNQKLECIQDFIKVRTFLFEHYKFEPGYYYPGLSGLSPAALDEIRKIVKEEVNRVYTVSVEQISKPRK